jgi:hypothetical protein
MTREVYSFLFAYAEHLRPQNSILTVINLHVRKMSD